MKRTQNVENNSKSKKIKSSSIDDQVLVILADHHQNTDNNYTPLYNKLKSKMRGFKPLSILTDYHLISTLQHDTLKPFDMKICYKHQCLFVTDYSMRILGFDLQTNQLKMSLSTHPFIPLRMCLEYGQQDNDDYIIFISNVPDQSIVKVKIQESTQCQPLWVINQDSVVTDISLKSTSGELFVCDWGRNRVIAMNSNDGSLKYFIQNDSTTGASLLKYDELSDSIFLANASGVNLINNYRGKSTDFKMGLWRLHGNQYELTEQIINFPDESPLTKLNGMILNMSSMDSYYLLLVKNAIYVYDKSTKQLIATIEPTGQSEMEDMVYDSKNLCFYVNDKYKFVEKVALNIEAEHLDGYPLSDSICEMILNLGGELPKKYELTRYRDDFIIPNSIAFFNNIKWPKHLWFEMDESVYEEEEEEEEGTDEEDNVGNEEDEEDIEEDNDEENNDNEEESEEEIEITDELMAAKPFPLSFTKFKTIDSSDHYVKQWISKNKDGIIIGGFERPSKWDCFFLHSNIFIGVKLSEVVSANFPVYILSSNFPFPTEHKTTLSHFLKHLRGIDCVIMDQFYPPERRALSIRFDKIYKQLLEKKVINPETNEIDTKILLNAYRKVNSEDGSHHRIESSTIFTVNTLILKEETISLGGTSFRKSDLLVLFYACQLGKDCVTTLDKKICVRLQFDEDPNQVVLV